MKLLLLLLLALVAVPVSADTVSERIEQIVAAGDTQEEEEFLRVDEAFVMTAIVTGPEMLNVSWRIADGYYLYNDKFRFEIVEETASIDSSVIQIPPGKVKEDPSFGRVEVLNHDFAVDVPVIRQSQAETPITLKLRYQGCKDNSICYPPVKKQVSLVLGGMTGPVSAAPTAAPPAGTMAQAQAPTAAPSPGSSADGELLISEQDSITQRLKDGGMLGNIFAFFTFGLLLSLTPCVFPMIPILSGIIVGQGKEITVLKGFTLSLVYVTAMALTYAVAGVIAAMLSFNLQAAAQNVWLLSFFSLVFVALSLSMFGFYEIQLPSSVQTRLAGLSDSQEGGTLAGVFIMGALSAIIVGPCVAPPLAAALLYISQTGDQLLGGLALFALGIGMGVPLLVLGASGGTLLPRAGMWMELIKKIFGVLMLAVAVWFLSRIVPPMVELYLWAALLIVTAIYMGALDRLPEGATWPRLWKGVGVVMLVYGVVLVVGGSAGSESVFKPLAGLARVSGQGSAEHAGLDFKQIKSLDNLNAEIRQANAAGRTVMLDFYADWCIACIEMETYTFPEPAVQDALRDVVLLQADVTANDEIDQELMEAFTIFGPPAILFFDRTGAERKAYRLVGFVEAEKFVAHVNKATGS